ncbi:MAG TPA: ribosome small subunit-dependent GTPase A [Prolixibacteraceae bacterium]|nr:ribosome small subunit-dependent GTPase A [Prolixibacteraceae bacterium]
MRLEDIGYNDHFERYLKENHLEGFVAGRVTAGYKERYMVRTACGEMEAEIIGNLRFTARSREDFPAVGDWVALTTYQDELAMIHRILPRLSVITRQAPGQRGEVQVIAANVDVAFLVQAVDRDFNINRLERYLTICYASGVEPVVVLTKTDLAAPGNVQELTGMVQARIKNVPVIAVSNETQEGVATLKAMIEKGRTYCLLGSSGVGKSTLINSLSGQSIRPTGSVSESTGKGRHVTTHRELFVLENGGILVDNPGMREVGLADVADGLEKTFQPIERLSVNCRYPDCTHRGEEGCAVVEAVEKGELDPAGYENYLKMARERDFFESSAAERRKRDKLYGRILKNYKKGNYKNK